MAKLGFYDIRTFETLNREVDVNTFNYKSIYDKVEEDEPEGANNDLKHHKQKKGAGHKSDANKRKAKLLNKSMHPVT